MINQSTVAFAILISLLMPSFNKEQDGAVRPREVTSTASARTSAMEIRDSIKLSPTPLPSDHFWTKLAQCETANDWQNGGQWAGGLGIYTKGRFRDENMGTWERFGGEEFAPSPDKATREEQIIVAERIGFLGWKTVVQRDPKQAERMGVPVEYVWNRPAVGLNGWGCYKSKSTGKYRMAKPRLYYSDKPSRVPLAHFYMGETGPLVRDLQTFLRIKVDGKYGPKTRKAHLRYLSKRGLSTIGVPSIKSSSH